MYDSLSFESSEKPWQKNKIWCQLDSSLFDPKICQDMPRLWSAQEIWHFQGAAFALAGPVPWYSGGADHTRARRIPDPKQRQSKTWGLWWLWLDLATHGVTGGNVVCSCLFFQLRFIAEHEPLNCSETCQALLSIDRQYNCQDTYYETKKISNSVAEA